MEGSFSLVIRCGIKQSFQNDSYLAYFFISPAMKCVCVCECDQSFHIYLRNLNFIIPDLEISVYFLFLNVFLHLKLMCKMFFVANISIL